MSEKHAPNGGGMADIYDRQSDAKSLYKDINLKFVKSSAYASDKIASARASDLGAQSAMASQSSEDISLTSLGQSSGSPRESATERAFAIVSSFPIKGDNRREGGERQPGDWTELNEFLRKVLSLEQAASAKRTLPSPIE